jgi:TonB family protein
MKPFLFTVICFMISITLLAQTKTITRDTINLIGVVYGSDGKPVSDLQIVSKQIDPSFRQGYILTKTDANGEFKLDGVMPNDTLTVVSVNYDKLQYYNKGSRLMVILLPQEHIVDINSANPIDIKAIRSQPKSIPQITFVPSSGVPPFTVIQQAEFPGGNEHFIEFIKKSMRYPSMAVKNNIEGTVEIAFTVEPNGKLDEYIILKGLGYGCDEEVIKAVLKSPSWRPAITRGGATSVKVSISVKFSLTDK